MLKKVIAFRVRFGQPYPCAATFGLPALKLTTPAEKNQLDEAGGLPGAHRRKFRSPRHVINSATLKGHPEDKSVPKCTSVCPIMTQMRYPLTDFAHNTG